VNVEEEYQGILFPDRAENLKDFDAYKVFLEHWDSLGVELGMLYEGLALRRDTRILAVFGEQGSGKTLFATQLEAGVERTKEAIRSANLKPDSTNLWHRVCGGAKLSPSLIEKSSARVAVHMVENNSKWVDAATAWLTPQSDVECLIIADNAERGYFRQGLLDLSDADFISLADQPETMKLVAQNLVDKCRNQLRGALLVLLSNDDLFLLSLQEAVDQQHEGLLRLGSLTLPGGRDKEAVVRVNTNRLNRISYWFCLDKAGPPEKRAVRTALEGRSTFPDAFAAVNSALRSAPPGRVGRPAKKNVLSLVVLSREEVSICDHVREFGEPSRILFESDWAACGKFSSGWARRAFDEEREWLLLESEWDLRLILLGRPFTRALVSDDADLLSWCARLLDTDHLQRVFGPGTRKKTREDFREEMIGIVEDWPDTNRVDDEAFWKGRQGRSEEYEAALRRLLPGYDRGGDGFLHYRPDYIVNGFRPAAVTAALSDDISAINAALKRDAHVLEFTAIGDLGADRIHEYLSGKLRNYLEITQEQ
jgi:hypothetical protein